MCPLLTPYLSAVFLTFLQNPGVAFQMQDNITVGSAISSRFIIHFEQPAPHFHVVNDQLTENTDHLWSRYLVPWQYQIVPSFTLPFLKCLDLKSIYGFCFLEILVFLQLSWTLSESNPEHFLIKNLWSSSGTWVHLGGLPNSNILFPTKKENRILFIQAFLSCQNLRFWIISTAK